MFKSWQNVTPLDNSNLLRALGESQQRANPFGALGKLLTTVGQQESSVDYRNAINNPINTIDQGRNLVSLASETGNSEYIKQADSIYKNINTTIDNETKQTNLLNSLDYRNTLLQENKGIDQRNALDTIDYENTLLQKNNKIKQRNVFNTKIFDNNLSELASQKEYLADLQYLLNNSEPKNTEQYIQKIQKTQNTIDTLQNSLSGNSSLPTNANSLLQVPNTSNTANTANTQNNSIPIKSDTNKVNDSQQVGNILKTTDNIIPSVDSESPTSITSTPTSTTPTQSKTKSKTTKITQDTPSINIDGVTYYGNKDIDLKLVSDELKLREDKLQDGVNTLNAVPFLGKSDEIAYDLRDTKQSLDNYKKGLVSSKSLLTEEEYTKNNESLSSEFKQLPKNTEKQNIAYNQNAHVLAENNNVGLANKLKEQQRMLSNLSPKGTAAKRVESEMEETKALMKINDTIIKSAKVNIEYAEENIKKAKATDDDLYANLITDIPAFDSASSNFTRKLSDIYNILDSDYSPTSPVGIVLKANNGTVDNDNYDAEYTDDEIRYAIGNLTQTAEQSLGTTIPRYIESKIAGLGTDVQSMIYRMVLSRALRNIKVDVSVSPFVNTSQQYIIEDTNKINRGNIFIKELDNIFTDLKVSKLRQEILTYNKRTDRNEKTLHTVIRRVLYK